MAVGDLHFSVVFFHLAGAGETPTRSSSEPAAPIVMAGQSAEMQNASTVRDDGEPIGIILIARSNKIL